jgi:hypothetical protein
MLYKKVNPWFSSGLSVSTSNKQIPHRQREHRNTFSTEALNSPNEVAAEIFLYRNGIFSPISILEFDLTETNNAASSS